MPEFPCPTPVTADVKVAAGSVEMFAEPRDTALVEVVPGNGSNASTEAAAQTRVELSGDTLLVETPEFSSWRLFRAPEVRVTIRVPTGSSGRFRLVSAGLTCEGECGDVRVNAASGNVDVARTTGDLTVNTASGDVEATRVDGRLTVKTASGDVSVRSVDGSVDAKSASGDVNLDRTGADVNVKTASGDTRVGTARRGTIRTNSVSGNVAVGVVTGTGVWLDLNTLTGRTRNGLDTPGQGGTGGTPSHELTIQVRSVSGNIDIHRVTPATTD